MGESVKTFYLKVNLSHPNKQYRIQKHVIGIDFEKFCLNEAEQKELDSPGPRKWVIQGTEKDFALAEKRRERLKKIKEETASEDAAANAGLGDDEDEEQE